VKEIQLRKALPPDAQGIRDLVKFYAEKGWMLPRPLSALYDTIRNFWVLERGGEIVGCAALNICWEDMAEIRSLAVADEFRGTGWGRVLVNKCLEEAEAYKIARVFTLTYVPEFFRKLGFEEIPKEALPHKIWRDCLDCPHFPDCKEVALQRTLG